MARKKQKTRGKRRRRQPSDPAQKGHFATYIVVFLLGAALTGLGLHLWGKKANDPSRRPEASNIPRHSLGQLLEMNPEQLQHIDVAEMNLLCAKGLPGAEDLDVEKCLGALDEWASRVRYWTERSLYDFQQRPDEFKNSEAKFRVLLLISVLQKDFGVHYNPERGLRDVDFSNPKDAFIHGMIDDENGGTCASMPVMYVAVGRRLGYPMKLVLAKTHIFARWQSPDGKERFNIEGTNAVFSDHPDSYYRNWPHPISDAELKGGWYLKSLTPAGELAVFLQNRACCLLDDERFKEAELAFRHSYRLAPQNPLGQDQIAYAAAAGRPVYGRPARGMPVRQFVHEFGAPMVYPDPRAEIERINAINRANMKRMTRPPQPPTRGVPQPPLPHAPNPYGPQPPRQPGRP